MDPFECKDIKSALVEIVTLNEKISALTDHAAMLNNTIRVHEENLALLQSAMLPMSSQPNSDVLKSNKYCLNNSCFTQAEFAIFGIGAFITGILAIVLVSWIGQAGILDWPGTLD